jgi:predicted hydrolase (HD superfamily)
MDADIVQSVARYAEGVLGEEGFRYVSAVVANCKMLAWELEAQEEEAPAIDRDIDIDALAIAGYLHDISTTQHGPNDHVRKSAEMAVEFLRSQEASQALVSKVEQVILRYAATDAEENTPIEARILYDADKLGRLSGLSVVTSLIEFGARYPNRSVSGEVLTAILRHIEERFIDLYQSLHTNPAREMARDKFNRTLAFLDGVIEHLSDSTPV